MPVSPATETKLRAAMQRLLNGTPQRTDGALTKENLAREAAVSHATVHRAETILSEWNARVDQPAARTAPGVPADEAITALRSALRDANQKITTLNGRLDALATVTANLYRENQALRAALDHRTQLAPLPGKEPN
jgi:small-conductance mechanosensitive channel